MYVFAIGMTGILMAAALLLVRRDYRSGEELTAITVVAVWAAYLVHVAVTVWFAVEAPWGRVAITATAAHLAGAFVAGFGTAIAVDGIATFASFERMSGRATDELVTEGIYRYSRNPQNVGWCVALLGAAVAGRSPSALALVGFFAAVIHCYVVWMEEPHLERLFGDDYRAYRERTPRYVGRPE